MLLNPADFDAHVAEAPQGALRDVFTAFAHAEYPGGLTARATSKGFIAHELRIEDGDFWYFSAVLNEEWVLWYFRKPAFRDRLVEMEAVRAAFPEAYQTPKGELSLRVRDVETARAIIGLLSAPQR